MYVYPHTVCDPRSVSSAVKKGFTNPVKGATRVAKPTTQVRVCVLCVDKYYQIFIQVVHMYLHIVLSQQVVVPYYNPNHPNALLLPRPPSSHQVSIVVMNITIKSRVDNGVLSTLDQFYNISTVYTIL